MNALWEYKLYLVVRHDEHNEAVIYPLAVFDWTVNWHTTFSAGTPTVGANASVDFQAATLSPGTPSPLVSPSFNHAHGGGGYR